MIQSGIETPQIPSLTGNTILVIGSSFEYKQLSFTHSMTFISFASYDSVSHGLMEDIAEELQQPRTNLVLENFKSFVNFLNITCK